jgi:excinuclease ABC subunit A
MNKIIIKGCRQHNLKNIDVEIPRDKLVVITGLSGSGKSSLAFDTIYAEGQRRYVESLSAYARQFLGQMDKPDVDSIDGLSPAIAIEQKTTSKNPRSTVGTVTEVYDYLRLLYGKVGRVHCPRCGAAAASHSAQSIADTLLAEHADARALVTFPLEVPSGVTPAELWASLTRRGFARVRVGDRVLDLAEAPPAGLEGARAVDVVLDRVVLDAGRRGRIVESVETALREGGGRLAVEIVDGPRRPFAAVMGCTECGIALERPQPLLFSFNHPLGACATCKGFGNILKYDEALVVPDRTRSLGAGAVEPWTHPSG